MFSKFRHQLLWLVIFLLPWQARYFFYFDTIGGQNYDAGQLGWYLSSAVIIIAFLVWLPVIRWPKNLWTISGLALAWIGLSINWAISPAMTLYYLYLVILAGMLWLMVRSADSLIVLKALIWAGAVQAILALLQFRSQFIGASSWLGVAQHDPHIAGQSVIIFHGIRLLRSYGSFSHPNILAGFLLITIIAWWLLALRRIPQRVSWHFSWCGLLALLYLGLFVTFSRAAIIAGVVAWIIMWVSAHYRKFPSGRSMLNHAGALAVVILILVNLTNGGLLLQRWQSSDRLEQMSVQDRVNSWTQWEQLMEKRPERWLIGISPNNYLPALAQTWPGQGIWSYEPVHNIYALILAEWGLAGIIMLLAMAWWVWTRVRHKHWDILVATTPLMALAIMGLFDHWLITDYSGLLLLALAFGLIRHRVYN